MSTNCRIKTANTKKSRCNVEIGFIRRIILTPVSSKFTGLKGGTAQTFEEWIYEGIHAALPENRFYPMPLTTNVEDNSTDPQEWSNPIGDSEVVSPGFFAFTQSYRRDACLSNRLVAFNQQEFRAIALDAKNAQMIEEANGDLKGELVTIYASSPKHSTPSELQEPRIIYKFKNPNEHDNRKVFGHDLDVNELEGLEEVEMTMATEEANIAIKFYDKCSGVDITAEFAALDKSTTAWLMDTAGVVSKLATGPVYNATGNKFTIAANTITGGSLKLADPAILYAAGVTNFEQPEWTDKPA